MERLRVAGLLVFVKRVLAGVSAMVFLCGCGGLRPAATAAQQENAWLHGRVCATAASVAVDEAASETLCGLTALAAEQSAAFVVDYGLPREVPAARDAATLLAVGGETAATAQADAARRADVWTLADAALELGIALAGLVGGAYGLRVAGYFKTAREKAAALKEIVEGNELYKQLWPEQAERFKAAQRKQSPATRQWVTAAKTAG